ncbi:hypothetical protein PR048_031328 [Dryococelus australis]|uniref:Uncharacterized protein n=1 Tax=Dryococelus australis TaxID=614101 RepID=A0ABQ9G914_9NEOP|nr:hypothetical protein PR048_031328 [Dryococelus australis]
MPPAHYSPQEASPLSPAEKRHTRVLRSWTKNVKIFQKFILIPINNNVNRFLGVICFLGLTGPVRMSDDTPLEVDIVEMRPRKSGKFLDSPSEFDHSLTPSTSHDMPHLEPIKQPCILFLTRCGEPRHGRMVATLLDYLRVESYLKEAKEWTFSRHTMQGACPRVHQQNNFRRLWSIRTAVCRVLFQGATEGLFPIRSLWNWFPESVVRRRREDICNLLSLLMKKSLKLPNVSPLSLADKEVADKSELELPPSNCEV